MRRTVVLLAVIGLWLWLAAPLASADSAAITVDNRSPQLSRDGSSWKTSVGFTNLTDRDIPLAIAPPNPGCNPSLSSATLTKAEHTAVSVTFPPACEVKN